jgi:hypothetical protein
MFRGGGWAATTELGGIMALALVREGDGPLVVTPATDRCAECGTTEGPCLHCERCHALVCDACCFELVVVVGFGQAVVRCGWCRGPEAA